MISSPASGEHEPRFSLSLSQKKKLSAGKHHWNRAESDTYPHSHLSRKPRLSRLPLHTQNRTSHNPLGHRPRQAREAQSLRGILVWNSNPITDTRWPSMQGDPGCPGRLAMNKGVGLYPTRHIPTPLLLLLEVKGTTCRHNGGESIVTRNPLLHGGDWPPGGEPEGSCRAWDPPFSPGLHPRPPVLEC